MSRFFDNLRSRLAGRFKLAPEPTQSPADTRGVTVVAYLPEEDSAIEMVFQVACLRKMSAASANRLDELEDLKRSSGLAWQLAMTFYLAENERAPLERRIAEIAERMGGRLEAGEGDFAGSGRHAA